MAVAAAVSALAAVVSAIVAGLLWKVTSKYTADTESIAEANRKMADANERVLDEMRQDRLHFHHQQSVTAAQRLTAALTAAMRDWTLAHDDPDATMWAFVSSASEGRSVPSSALTAAQKRERAYLDWQVAYFNETGALANEVFQRDVVNFTAIMRVVTHDWLDVREVAGNEHAAVPQELWATRLQWAADRLRTTLEAHRRGEVVTKTVLTDDEWSFWSQRGLSDEELLEKMGGETGVEQAAVRSE